MIKALFFDIDNTLYSWQTLRFISSGIRAIKKAKRNGVKVFLCSARPYATIKEFGLMDLGIAWDGYIASCGTVTKLGRHYLKKDLIPASLVRKVCKTASSYELTMEIVTPKTRYMTNPGNTFLEGYRGTYADKNPPVHPYRGKDVTSMLLFAPESFDPLFRSRFPELNYFRFHEFGVDLSLGVHEKGAGIQVILDALGIKKDEALSFGDDLQDISMGDSSILVCVGNGKDEVKAAADYVADPIDEDGVEKALRHFGVIA